MSLAMAAAVELADDPRFPDKRILYAWLAGADKKQIIHAINYRQWPIVAMGWLSPEDQRRLRQRATILAKVDEMEVMMSGQ